MDRSPRVAYGRAMSEKSRPPSSKKSPPRKASSNDRGDRKPGGEKRSGRPKNFNKDNKSGGKDRKFGGKPGGRSGGRSDRKPGGKPGGKPDWKKKSSPRRPSLTNAQRARQAAAHAVGDVLGRGYRLEGSLAKSPALEGLDARDRAFARAIAATTLRRLGQIDAVLAPLVKRSPPGRVQAFLQTAAAQMIFMDVAPHAAVGDTVALVKDDRKGEPFSGLVNAVLRKVAETGKADAARVPPVKNIPGWMRSEWERLYGKAAVRRMAVLLSNSPTLDLSVKSDPTGWAERLGGDVIGETTVRLDSIGNVAALDGYETGDWWAQDVAAALPAKVLEQVAGGLGGKRVADLCAAPGGKTLQLSSMGGRVTSVDLSEARTQRLRENLERSGLDAEIIISDLEAYQPEELFEAVLLDSPCSATGTFRRHPDVLYNRRERDITPLTRLQDKLLSHAANCVSPGGVLVYSVCSLQEREGAARVNAFLKAMPDFRLVELSDVPGLDLSEDRTKDGMIRILPSDAPDGRGMDGFFIAALKKAA